jgi:hypothetical protein
MMPPMPTPPRSELDLQRAETIEQLGAALHDVLGQAPPRWWLELLASGKRAGDEAGPPVYDVAVREQGDRRGPWVSGPGHTRVRPGVDLLLTADGDGRLHYDLSSARLELGPLPSDAGRMIELARACAGTTVYYATFNPSSGGCRFSLHAIAARGGGWTAEVRGSDREGLGGHLIVEIVVLERGEPSLQMRAAEVTGVAVFTGEAHGLTLDLFDPDDGARRLAWSSEGWLAR